IGVAPDARWIAAGITECPGASYPSMNIAAYQWAMNPDSNAATMDMPDVINCSWRDPTATDECTSSIYRSTLTAVEAAGIAVVFSSGNSGPSASTITPPKNINIDSVNVFCVGAVDGNSAIASFSSRGPSLCGGTGTLLIKPEISAPGVSVRSSYSGISYASLSGTSMASPHVAGCIALLKQAAPNMTGKQLKAILFSTATDLGTAGEDNNYGKGLVNVNKAYTMLGSVPPVAANITLIQEGFYNSVTNRLAMKDTVRIYLKNITSPFAIVDSGKGVLDSVTYTASVLFNSAPSGTYYLIVKHRNCVETWSKAGGEVYTRGSVLNYNFTTLQSQAYGNNMKLVDTSPSIRYGIYSGDVNQDYQVNLADINIIYNDLTLFVTGYVRSDLTGDRVTNLNDQLICYNNEINFVTRIAPPGAGPVSLSDSGNKFLKRIRKTKTILISIQQLRIS
ncbi:MAG: S8 family serine peptidase, partial [Bacteroidota bacterium]|nr:S8 family serine peptidase [Bacteroidota bacterium]